MAIPSNALLLADLEVGEIYQDRLSYQLVFVVTISELGAVTARYYNPITGLFENYTAYDYSLISLTNVEV